MTHATKHIKPASLGISLRETPSTRMKPCRGILIIFGLFTLTECDIIKLGNELLSPKESTVGAELSGSSFLLNDHPVQQPGSVFGFAAYIQKQTPVTFQIVRPVGSESFVLLRQWTFNPTITEGIEKFYISDLPNGNCSRTEIGDHLAVYFPESPGPVAYRFNLDGQTFQSKTNSTVEGLEVEFDTLPFPYKFSIALYLDTSITSEDSCPSSAQIPDESNSSGGGNGDTVAGGATGSTGQMGSTGATGLRGATGPKGGTGFVGPQGLAGIVGRQGFTGPMGGIGATGMSGMPGVKGEEGNTGPKGERGLPGPAGASQNQSFDKIVEESTCSWCSALLDPYLVLGLIIWLAIVSLLLIAFMIYSCRSRPQQMSYANGINRDDLWKKYDNAGYEKEEPTYAAISEGKTSF